jgi:hypothetical protein
MGGGTAMTRRCSSEGGMAPMARGAAPHRGLPLGPAHEERERSVRAGDGGRKKGNTGEVARGLPAAMKRSTRGANGQ